MTWFEEMNKALTEAEMGARLYDPGRYRRAVETLKELGSDVGWTRFERESE